ncbi:MAG: T9SS type A sorting domain-containing protein [Bacteroidales bacterium]|nr:T9SS type A sorting domain-containing protein [Bacteroidales bacterium]
MRKNIFNLFLVISLLGISTTVVGQPKFHTVPKQNMQGLNFNNPNSPAQFNLPTHTIPDFYLIHDDNPEQLSTFVNELVAVYPGFTPVFAHQIVNDRSGNLLFFIVDNFIYNKNGYGFEKNSTEYHVLKEGDDAYYNPYEECTKFTYRLHNDIIVVPVPEICNEFYIFYATLHCESGHMNYLPHIFMKKLTYINENEIELTSEIELYNANFKEGCNNYSGFSMDITPYNNDFDNYLLVIQWYEQYEVFEVSNTVNNTPKFFEHEYRLDDPVIGCKRPDAVISLDNSGNVVFFNSSIWGTNDACLLYNKFPRDFDDINETTIEIGHLIVPQSIIGLEISPNKSYLYFTLHSSTGIFYFDIDSYMFNNGTFPTTYSTLSLTGDYHKTQLEMFGDNKIYALDINSITEKGTYTSINNPNTPTNTTFSYSCFNSCIVDQTFIIDCTYEDNEKRFVFNHQTDNSDYETGYPFFPSDQPDWGSIGSNVTWSPGATNNPFGSESGIVYLDEDFVIPTGKYVKLSNMEFYFANGKKAIVNIGSTLRLEGTKLSAETTCTPTAMWSGVYLEGTKDSIQSVSKQGTLSMAAGSEISNAITAVTVEGGAICKIYAGDFINNKTGIYFYPHSYSPAPNYNAGLVQLANFLVDDALNNQTNPYYQIIMQSVKGINITSSTFINSRESSVIASNRGYGIRSISSNFKVLNSIISGFYYGAYLNSGTPRILNNSFENNFRGLYSGTGTSVEVTGNTFDGDFNFTPASVNAYSCYIAGNGVNNTLYKFENNTIQNGSVGAQFYNLGPNAVKVKDNTFINIDGYTQSCAAVAIGKNSDFVSGSGGDYGLEFRCNNFDDNPYALSVIDGNMRKYQGEFGASSGSDYAGNAFDHYGTNTERDFYVKVPIVSSLEIPQYQYYSHSDNAHKIMYYTVSRIVNVLFSSPFIEDYCEEGGGGGIILQGMSVGAGSDLIEDTDTEIMLKEYELSEATDNGQTYTLISEVETMTSQNSTEVAETIAELDGYISDELAISLMHNDQANQFAKAGALLENSPLPVAVIEEIDNMEMNPTLKQIIKENQKGTNPRNAKEAEIAELKQYRSLVISEMYNSAINNDSVPAEKEALETFLKNDNNLQSKVHLFNLYKHNRNFEAANATLNTIKLSLVNEDLDYRSEMENYLELEKIMLDIEFRHANLNEAVANNFELIDFIANNESYAGQVSAQLLLQEAGLAEYSELIKLPEPVVTPKNAVINNKPAQAVKYDDIINVYPNPASDVFYVEYALMGQDSNTSLQILNLNGSIIENIKLKKNAGIFVYNKKLAAGTYIIKVGNNYTQKITIN